MRRGAILLGGIGGLCLLFGLAAAINAGAAGYGEGCGHAPRIVAAAASGLIAGAIAVAVRRRPPRWFVVVDLVATAVFVAADTSLSNDYLAGGGCRYADRAATEDAISAGWLTFA